MSFLFKEKNQFSFFLIIHIMYDFNSLIINSMVKRIRKNILIFVIPLIIIFENYYFWVDVYSETNFIQGINIFT